MKIRIGTRGSELALWQAEHVSSLIGKDKTEIVIIKTQGDKIQNVSFDKMEGKGFFTKEIEEALLDKRIDLAVHSLKDLPTENPEGLVIAAIPEREDPSDVLLIHEHAYDKNKNLPLVKGSLVGTSSMRRMAQLKNHDKSLTVEALRGNINTRLRKINEKRYDAIVMAYAGIKRINLDLKDLIMHKMDNDFFVPAPAQGALGLQVREDDHELIKLLNKYNHDDTVKTVRAERSFLQHFGGGCHIPLGAKAVLDGDIITLTGIVAAPEGTNALRNTISGNDPDSLGAELAGTLKEKGADKLL